MNSSPNVFNRVRSEYLEMPGLTLKSEQVQRLCGIDDIACKVVLAALVGPILVDPGHEFSAA